MSAATISLSGVGKSYRRQAALRDVDLVAGRGITGLLGPNGAGKSTLLRIVATTLAPDRGRLRLLGLDPADADERVAIRRRLGYLPQHVGVHRHFTAFAFVDHVAVLKEMTGRRARHAEVLRVLRLVVLCYVVCCFRGLVVASPRRGLVVARAGGRCRRVGGGGVR